MSLVSKWVKKAGKWVSRQVGQEVARVSDKYGDSGELSPDQLAALTNSQLQAEMAQQEAQAASAKIASLTSLAIIGGIAWAVLRKD